MSRIRLDDRKLPGYTRSEEIFNMVSHIVGGAFGLLVLLLCAIFASRVHNWRGLAGGLVYGFSMIFLYTMSSLYHGVTPERPKKVLQVMDHCTIYALILGTWTPILLTGLWDYSRGMTIAVAALLLVGTAVGVTFTAIDFKTYKLLAYGGYFVVGWIALFVARPMVKAFGWPFFLWLLAGGVTYTLGMVFYAVGRKKKYFHSVFHLFILGGSILQFVAIFLWCVVPAY